jgi:hypothetical protein
MNTVTESTELKCNTLCDFNKNDMVNKNGNILLTHQMCGLLSSRVSVVARFMT